jgi:rubrerythrin
MKPRTLLLLLAVALACFAVGWASADNHTRLHHKTQKNLMTAMHGEAFAYAKYMLFAEHARSDGNAELADLFEKTAKVEHLEHLSEEAKLAGIVGSDQENLREAIKGESYEIETMYREFASEARSAGDHGAAARFEEIRKDETSHRDAFRAALAKLETTHEHHTPGK